MQFKRFAFLLILSVLVFSGCDSKDEAQTKEETIKETKQTKIIKTDLTLKTTDNKTITIDIKNDKVIVKEYPNKVILLNFFATWCPPCKVEIPNLINLQNRYNNDFQVISILLETNKTNEEMNKFIQEYNINYPILNGQVNYSLSDKLGGVSTIPTMFMIGKDQKIFQKYVGIVPIEMMEIDIRKVLQKKGK